MQRVVQFSSVCALTFLAGCASVFSGTTQSITVETQPEGADCKVSKSGFVVGEVQSTPGYVRVNRGSVGLEIACTKPGYATARTAQPTQIESWVFGNVIAGGLIGIVVDFSDGAAYRYDGYSMLAMQESPSGQGPVISSSVPTNGNGYTYQQLTRTYPSRGEAADPLIVPPATPQGDVTYRWRTTD
jgi:hypothetical protein